jgi:predicted  nucleic acid-binding Zn-ribbon protein
MTNEEFERLKDSLRVKLSHNDSNAEAVDLEKAVAAANAARERRKLDRDMNRLERVLRKLADAPKETKRQLEDSERWNQFKESTERWQAQIREIGARSDAKIKALVEEMQRRHTRPS